MKEGDKIYCVKTVSSNRNYINFEEGKSYFIKSIFENSNRVYIQYKASDGNNYLSGFFINSGGGWHTFSEHFIDLKKQRKLKLEKISNGSNMY